MLRNLKVLFVDDEPHVLAAIARKLRKDFDVVTACGSFEGLSCLDEYGPFVAVVADMQMPGMDGIAFLQLVRSIQPDAVRIMLTGNADQSTVRRALEEAEIARFLNKPCSPESLRDAIIETVDAVSAA
jgi:response regulator RpfG family c-di-GMP phosphodiesterase